MAACMTLCAQVQAALGGVERVLESMQANAGLLPLAAPSGIAASLCHPSLPCMVAATNEILEMWKVGACEQATGHGVKGIWCG